MKKSILFICLICIFCLAFVLGCSRSSSSRIKKGVVRVAYMPYYASVPLQVIIDEGLDKKYGIEIIPTIYPTGGTMGLLESDQWDIGQIGAGGMYAISRFDAKLIADIQYEMDGAWMLAREDSSIVQAGNTLQEYPDVLGSVETLENAEILIGVVGNISHYMALDYVQKFGIDISNVKFIDMKTDDVPEAFLSGQGDIACFGNPTTAMDFVNDGGYVRVGGLKQQGIPQQDIMIANSKYYDTSKDDIVRFMAAWYEATSMLNGDTDYEFEMTKKFYRSNGREVTDVSVAQECSFNSYIDASNFYEKEIGSWIVNLAKCYVSVGTVEASTSIAIEKGIKTELAQKAISMISNH